MICNTCAYRGQCSTVDGLGDYCPALGELNPVGQRYVREALQDREAAPIARKLLASGDPSAAMEAQIESDIAEVVNPAGKVIVFKSLARRLGGKINRATRAVVAALPSGRTEAGRAALTAIVNSTDTFPRFYQAV